MTHIDTAEYYGVGHCEEVVADAIEPFNRKDLFITTKVWRNHLRRDDLINSMKASLKRLRQDYVDLYLVHWPDSNVPLKETMGALDEIKALGWRILDRWNKELYGVVCGNKGDDQKDETALDQSSCDKCKHSPSL